jgi:hypothetical protein
MSDPGGTDTNNDHTARWRPDGVAGAIPRAERMADAKE